MPEGERVRMTFTSFDLVPEVCGDFVQVYDGHKPGSSIMGKHVTRCMEDEGSKNLVEIKFIHYL